jgi:hypothetical protein
MDKTQISHPYPPSYRVEASPEPTYGGQAQQYGLQDPYRPSQSPQPPSTHGHGYEERTSSSDSDPTEPLTPHAHVLRKSKPDKNKKKTHAKQKSTTHHGIVHVGMIGGLVDNGHRKDENGLDIPAGWDEKDEEAEREFMKQGMFDWKAFMGWRYWIRKEWWGEYFLRGPRGKLMGRMVSRCCNPGGVGRSNDHLS